MGIWAYFGDNFFGFSADKKLNPEAKTKEEEKRRKRRLKMRSNTHFFSHFSLKLGITDINWEKLVKDAKNGQKTMFI